MRAWKIGLAIAALPIVAVALWQGFVHAVLPDANAPLTAKAVAPDAYVIRGGLSNMGFVVGRTSLIAIDAAFFPQTAANAAAIMERMTHKPVGAVILTHSDPDHVNGLPAFPAGTPVYAHPNTRREMMAALDSWRPNPSAPTRAVRGYLPSRLVERRADLRIDGVHIILLHIGPAHTDGDVAIYLPDDRLVFAGDLIAPEAGPGAGIHLEKHGSSLGWIAFVRALLALDADRYVAGHGGVISRQELEASLRYVVEQRAQIAALVGKGMSIEQVRAATGDKPRPGMAARFPTFVETTYQELAEPKK